MNKTAVNEFILLAFSQYNQLQILIFLVILLMYMTTVIGNIIIIGLIKTDLHTPMYFFIGVFAALEISFVYVTVPKLLANLIIGMENTISVKDCITQLHFFHFLGCAEGVLLAAMGYDRYVAICQPLRYNNIMNKSICVQLVLGSWITGLIYATIHSVMTSHLPFCTFEKVHHFFCDVKPVIKLACTDTRLNEITLTTVSGLVTTGTFLLTMISYCYISGHLLQIRTAKGRCKAFSTCSSHLTIVILFYGTAMCTYLGPFSEDSIEKDKVAAILFTVVTPTLNPLIYTLRNKEVKRALRKFLTKSVSKH
uniref:Olfactory receptor n=1 Tax=Leptobrachium leishanense TaxID=445787 RepID=A0A8C5PCZ5_9ANUR